MGLELQINNSKALFDSSDKLLTSVNEIISNARSLLYLVNQLKDAWSGDAASEAAVRKLEAGAQFLEDYTKYNKAFAEEIYSYCKEELKAN